MDKIDHAQGSLYLKRYSGEEVYPIEQSTYQFDFDSKFHRYNLYLQLRMGKLIGGEISNPHAQVTPSWELHFPLIELEMTDIKPGLQLELLYGVLDSVDHDYCALFHFYESIPSFKNKMEIIEQKGDALLIRLKAATDDVEHYDGTKPYASISAEAWFTFKKTKALEG